MSRRDRRVEFAPKPSKMTGCPLLILGSTRSGTSACALAMRALGVNFGRDEDVSAVSEHNPDGIMENRQFLQFSRNMLALYQGDSTGTATPANWREWPETPGLLESLCDFIPKYFAGSDFYGWKDPRITILLPPFLETFRRLKCQPHFLMPLRHPLDVAASWERTYRVQTSTSVGFWTRFMLTALKDLQNEDLYLCSYRDLLADPRAALEEFVSELPVSTRTEAQWEAVRAAIRPELSHSERSLEELETMRPDLPYRIYLLALEISQDRKGSREGRYNARIDELYDEWANLRELNRIDIQQVRVAAKWSGGDGKLESSSTPYRSDRVWTKGTISLSDAGDGRMAIQFQPTGSVVFLRGLSFRAESERTFPVEVIPSGLAYMDRLPGDMIRLLCHADGPHLAFSMPPSGTKGEFQFEIMADYSARSLSWVVQQASAEVMRLRGTGNRALRL